MVRLKTVNKEVYSKSDRKFQLENLRYLRFFCEFVFLRFMSMSIYLPFNKISVDPFVKSGLNLV